MAKKAPVVMLKTTIGAAVADCLSTLQDLGGELREWYDNLPENFQQNRDDISEAADALENITEPDDCPVQRISEVEFEYRPVGKRETSRRARRDQACYEARTAVEMIEGFLEDDSTLTEDEKSELEDWARTATDMIDEAEGVDFPGMRG